MLRAAFSSMRRRPEKLADQLQNIWKQLPAVDQTALQNSLFSEGIIEITRDAIANGVTGWVNEEILMTQPWGFDIAAIRHPNLFLWHGLLDSNVPAAMAKAVAAKIPACRSTFIPEEGHLSILLNHGEEIVRQLIGSLL
jgi:hypothetical protein